VSAGVKLNPGAYFTPVFRTGAKLTPGLKNAYFLRVASKYKLLFYNRMHKVMHIAGFRFIGTTLLQ